MGRKSEGALLPEEDVRRVVLASVVLPLDFGTVEKVLHFFVQEKIPGGVFFLGTGGGGKVGLGFKGAFFEGGPDPAELATDMRGRATFETMDDGEGLFELIEPIILFFGEILVEGDFTEGANFLFDKVGEPTRGVMIGA